MKRTLPLILIVILFNTVKFAKADEDMQCPEFLDHEFKMLHSSNMLNLCSLYKDKPILIVNTASHCGYTPQFKSLEALYQKYKKQGVQVIGFASNDFNQEAKSEEEAADICYKNYGVTFTMFAPTKVKGEEANDVFAYLAKHSGKQPQWNFNKYFVSADGQSIKHFSEKELLLGGDIEKLIIEEL